VFKPAADDFQPVARYRVADKPTWAHPAVVENGIVVKGADSVAL